MPSKIMTLKEFIQKVRKSPDEFEFDQTMAIINENYHYTPTRFTNGEIINEVGTNEGSCKIFAFGQLNALSEMETLALFGKYYREDVLENPDGEDHANIRNFILDGWLGIRFDKPALEALSTKH